MRRAGDADEVAAVAADPVRSSPPVYAHPPVKVSSWRARRAGLSVVVENLVFGVAALLAVGFAVVVLRAGLTSWTRAAYLVGFWVVLAYLALPRIHRILTAMYVPGYFIGRARTSDGLLGDPVNLAFTGAEQQVHTAMTAAGWIQADPVDLRSSLRIVTASLTRRSYPTAPVSPLLLFDRVQDFAYQQEVAGNPARRHHVRFWRCPDGWLLPGGHRVDWLAAGTYDRSVGLSLFTFQVTHKIDQNIDIERDYIVDTLRYAVPSLQVATIADFSSGYHSRSGGGDRVSTDGDLPVVEVGALPGPQLTADPEPDDALHRLGRRPVSVVAAVALALVSILISLVQAARTFPEVTEQLAGEDPRLASAQVTVAIVVTVTTYLLMGLLAWRIYAGGRWARRMMIVLFLGTVVLEVVQALWGSRPTDAALFNMSVDLLALYALTSRSAADWTRARAARRRR